MAYIYKKIVGGKPYYYLRISKRVKGKLIVKDVAYLGSSLAEVEKKLNSLDKYQKEIRKSYRNIKKFIQSNHYLDLIRKKKLKKNEYIEKGLHEEIEAIKLHFNNHFLKLDSKTKEEAYKNFLIDFAFNTTSIEGNTITLKEAERLLQEDILPKNRTLREVYDLQNTEKVFFWLMKTKPKFDESLIIAVHDRLMENIDKRKGYRTHDIKVFKSRFEATPAKFVKTDMKLLMRLFKKHSKMHPLVLAGIFHHKLEKIHPFADGNGRTGRMLMNYYLVKKGHPPMIVSKKKRSKYLEILSKADKAELTKIEAKHYKPLIKYFSEELIESYWQNYNL